MSRISTARAIMAITVIALSIAAVTAPSGFASAPEITLNAYILQKAPTCPSSAYDGQDQPAARQVGLHNGQTILLCGVTKPGARVFLQVLRGTSTGAYWQSFAVSTADTNGHYTASYTFTHTTQATTYTMRAQVGTNTTSPPVLITVMDTSFGCSGNGGMLCAKLIRAPGDTPSMVVFANHNFGGHVEVAWQNGHANSSGDTQWNAGNEFHWVGQGHGHPNEQFCAIAWRRNSNGGYSNIGEVCATWNP
jgi:hypothetical protein